MSITGAAPSFDEVKREFDRGRLIALAQAEGLSSKPGRIQCPATCSDDPRGASVSPDGLFHCQRCGASGSAVDLVMARRRVDNREALRILVESLGHLPPPVPPKTK